MKDLVAHWNELALSRENLLWVSASLEKKCVVPRQKTNRGAKVAGRDARVQKAAEQLKKSNFGAVLKHGLRTLAEASHRARRNLSEELSRLTPSRRVARPNIGGVDGYDVDELV